MARPVDIDEDNIKTLLDSVVQNIHEQESPEELDAYRALFKKNVSIFKRGYVSAYLLKYALKGKNFTKTSRPKIEGTTLFVSIGKSRRVFPRDLVGLILDTTKIERDDIGNIKIKDKYSFVDIKEEQAQTVIDKLNGYEYRGMPLTVNFAKKRA